MRRSSNRLSRARRPIAPVLGHAGYFTGWPKKALNEMIEVVKKIEPDTGYRPIMHLSEIEAAMREVRVKKTKTVCNPCL